jgi:alpha/beta superfamily hydrolase
MRLASGIALALLLVVAGAALLFLRVPEGATPLSAPDMTGIAVEEITFESDGLQLAAQLFRPEGEVVGTAVIIQGSGESRRGNPWYLQVVRALADVGVAVLLPDKRGSDSSEGDWRTSSFDALARDARVATGLMRERFPDAPLTLIGMSQGGRIAPLAATGEQKPDRVVSLSGGVERAFASLVFEETNTLRQMGLPDAVARSLAPLTAWHLREVRQPVFWAAVGDFDPLPHWAALDRPGLILLGGLDRDDNLDVDRAIERIGSLESDHIELRVFEDLDHALRRTGQDSIDDEVIESLAGFVRAGRL